MLIYSKLRKIKLAEDEKKNEKKERYRINEKSMKKLNYLNSITLNFNLREPYGNKATNIYAVIKINRKQIKVAIGLKINCWQWNKAKQVPIINNNMSVEDKENALNVINKIYEINVGFQKFLAYTCSSEVQPTESDIKEVIINILNKKSMKKNKNLRNGEGRKPKATTLLKKAFEIYYKEMHTTIKESSIKVNEIRLKAYYDYCDKKNKDALSLLSQKGINEYRDYLMKKSKEGLEKGEKRCDSTKNINNKCELIERLINNVMVGHSAFTRYKISPIKYIRLGEVNQKGEEKKRRPLTEEEIEKLATCRILSPKEEEYRDLFLLECYASCRISDIPKLFNKSEQEIIRKGDYELIVINTQKENITCVIWVNEFVRNILGKYKEGFKFVNFHSKSFQTKYGTMIKEVAQKAQLDKCKKYKDAHNRIIEQPLYDIIGSHFARYTFIYNGLFKYGFTPIELKDFTGHRDDRMINECYKIETAEDKANNACKAINRVLGEKEKRSRITRDSINDQTDLIKEVKEALYCLGADTNELIDINYYHKLNELLYIDYHEKYQKMGCDMRYLKELYLDKNLTLKEKRELIFKVIDEVKCKKNIF